MSTYAYRAMWPILDPDRTIRSLITEACASLDAMARTDGARITGEPEWVVAGDRLLVEAPAEPLPEDEPADVGDIDHEAVVLRLAGLHWSDEQIALTAGVPRSTVRSILARQQQPTAA